MESNYQKVEEFWSPQPFIIRNQLVMARSTTNKASQNYVVKIYLRIEK